MIEGARFWGGTVVAGVVVAGVVVPGVVVPGGVVVVVAVGDVEVVVVGVAPSGSRAMSPRSPVGQVDAAAKVLATGSPNGLLPDPPRKPVS